MFTLKKLLVILTIALVVCPLDVFARGGGRGGGGGGGGRGGGGGGGYHGGGGSMSRSPSMSRPAPSPSRPSPSASRPSASRPSTGAAGSRPSGSAGARPGASAGARPSAGNVAGNGRPTQGQLNNFLNVPSQGARPGGAGPAAGSRPAGGNAAVSDFFQSSGGRAAAGVGVGAATGAIAGNRAGQAGNRTAARSDARGGAENRGNRQTARVESRGEHRSSLAEGRGDRQTQRQQQRGERADSIRDQLGEHFDDTHLFEDFWRDNPGAYMNFQQNPALWSWAAFSTVSAFMPWNWGAGNYYDYGSGGSSSSGDPGTVYADEATYSSPEYCEQAEQLAASAPEEPPADTEWLSLGVFAASADDKGTSVPNMFLQLAVSKEGIIAGTYQNKTTGQTESLEGMVDQESQRVAWTVSGKNTPIMESGLQNLTMNETQALVHFSDGTTQNWLLVRVAKPEGEQTTQPAASPQPGG